MLRLDKLNDTSFDDIYDTALKTIERFGTEWTNLQESDPGMTLVDLFAWLKAIQHEYMSIILPDSRRRFLSLLDIRQRRGRGARTMLSLSGSDRDLEVPAETRWPAGDLIFENPEPALIPAAVLQSVSFRGPDGETAIDPSHMDGVRIFDLFPGLGPAPMREPDADLTLWFDRPLPLNRPLTFFFSLEEDPRRQPVTDTELVPLADIAWEVLTDSGWTPVQVLKDNTYGFLYSGIVRLQLTTAMAQDSRGFGLRARLCRDDYDLAPRLRQIHTGVVEVQQQETLIRCDEIPAGEPAELRSNLAIYGMHRVFLQQGDGWLETNQFVPSVTREKLTLQLPPHDGAVRVLSFDERAVFHMILGSGTGFSGQSLEFPYKDALYDSVRIMVGRQPRRGGDTIYTEWEKQDDLFSSGPTSRIFILDLAEEEIRFGNNERGVIPPKGNGNILLVGLKLCKGKYSNIRDGQIRSALSKDPDIGALKVLQLGPASGGEDAETFDETAVRAGETLRSGEKAVTEEDYLHAVHAAPGLVVENCRVLTGFDGPEDARVTVVLQGTGRARYRRTEGYERNLRRMLNRRRLLNTQINVVWPEPVRLVIRGRIISVLYYPNARERILETIRSFVEKLNEKFGTPFSYGEFYCAIDMLECVSSIEALHVEPIGGFLSRTPTDDILVPPNSYYIVERYDLNMTGNL